MSRIAKGLRQALQWITSIQSKKKIMETLHKEESHSKVSEINKPLFVTPPPLRDYIPQSVERINSSRGPSYAFGRQQMIRQYEIHQSQPLMDRKQLNTVQNKWVPPVASSAASSFNNVRFPSSQSSSTQPNHLRADVSSYRRSVTSSDNQYLRQNQSIPFAQPSTTKHQGNVPRKGSTRPTLEELKKEWADLMKSSSSTSSCNDPSISLMSQSKVGIKSDEMSAPLCADAQLSSSNTGSLGNLNPGSSTHDSVSKPCLQTKMLNKTVSKSRPSVKNSGKLVLYDILSERAHSMSAGASQDPFLSPTYQKGITIKKPNSNAFR